MKKLITALMIIVLVISAAGCGIADISIPQKKVFTIDAYNLQITANSTFYESTDGELDIQITNDKARISVFAYCYDDLSQNITPLDIYELQNEELFNKRDNVTIIENAETQSFENRSVTKALFSGERNNVKNYYAAYLIDFPNEEVCAWVLVTSAPSHFKAKREYYNSIVCSLKPMT